MSEALIGARVRIVSGPCAGFVGVVTATKKHPAKADVTIGEYRIAFDPPAYLPTADSRPPGRGLAAADRFYGGRKMTADDQTTKAALVRGGFCVLGSSMETNRASQSGLYHPVEDLSKRIRDGCQFSRTF